MENVFDSSADFGRFTVVAFLDVDQSMTWLRVSSIGGIADAGSVLVNAMGRQHRRGGQRL